MAIFPPDLRPPCPALPDKPIFFLVISTILTLFTDSRETALVGWYFNNLKFTSSLTFLDKILTEIVKHPFNSPLPSDWHPLPLWPSDNYITVTSVASDLISFIFSDSSPPRFILKTLGDKGFKRASNETFTNQLIKEVSYSKASKVARRETSKSCSGRDGTLVFVPCCTTNLAIFWHCSTRLSPLPFF